MAAILSWFDLLHAIYLLMKLQVWLCRELPWGLRPPPSPLPLVLELTPARTTMLLEARGDIDTWSHCMPNEEEEEEEEGQKRRRAWIDGPLCVVG